MGRPRADRSKIKTPESHAARTLKKLLSGRLPADMLPLVPIKSIFQRVTYPGLPKPIQILRLTAAGHLTFGREEDKDGQAVYVAGTDDWGWLWRFSEKDAWDYLMLIAREARRDRT